MNWIDLTKEDKQILLEQLSSKIQLDSASIEKDWWVTMVLKALFSSEYAPHLSFKGGTSLSKCFRLISRFSEDVDIAINREFLGFAGELSKTQISDRLRRKSCAFVREDMTKEVENQLIKLGVDKIHFSVDVNVTSVTTTDPETIEVSYNSALPLLGYVRNVVLIEVGARSMIEPTEMVSVCSIIAENLL